MNPVDFGRHSDDYVRFRPGFPASFYDRLDALAPIAGARALDLATGPGVIALELAARGAQVVGIDVSPPQIAAAEQLAHDRQLARSTRFAVAPAEDTGLRSDSFDLVTSGQSWHWFDPVAALTEARRVLRPGGVLVIAHYTYLAEHDPLARDTEDLILQVNPAWTMSGWTGIFPELIDGVIRGGLELVEQFCYQHAEPFTHVAWRGRMRTCNGVGSGDLSPEEVQRFDDELARMLARKYPDPVKVDHRVWCVVAREPE